MQFGIKEPSIGSVHQYAKRTWWLAFIYFALFLISVVGDTVVAWNSKTLVTLSQRSNVETLTLAFFFVFFLYIAFVSASGAWGFLKLLYVFSALGPNKQAKRELRKIGLLRRGRSHSEAALNKVVRAKERESETVEISIRDDFGSLGSIRFDGARIIHTDPFSDGSNTLFAFITEELNRTLKARGIDACLDVVEWKKIDDEETEKFLGLVQFACNLEKALGSTRPLWPSIELEPSDLVHLEEQLSALCPHLRSEALLPDWEYAGEHKLPIIPEPLGIISLSRTEKRVDPIASMSAALAVLGVVLVLLVVIILFPPWVPSA